MNQKLRMINSDWRFFRFFVRNSVNLHSIVDPKYVHWSNITLISKIKEQGILIFYVINVLYLEFFTPLSLNSRHDFTNSVCLFLFDANELDSKINMSLFNTFDKYMDNSFFFIFIQHYVSYIFNGNNCYVQN